MGEQCNNDNYYKQGIGQADSRCVLLQYICPEHMLLLKKWPQKQPHRSRKASKEQYWCYQ